ncbi:MAG: TrbC/VirB2 family protein [Patescibacteria group bacterium]|jgi:hypothetical protein
MSKWTKKISIALFVMLLAVTLLPVGPAAATTTNFGLEYAGNLGLQNTNPKNLIVNVIQVALGFLGLIAVIIIIVGGFYWMTAGGNDEKVTTGRKYIVNGIIGLVIILAAYGITSWVITTLNTEVLT